MTSGIIATFSFILHIFNITLIVPADNRLILSLLADGQHKLIGPEQLILCDLLLYLLKIPSFFIFTWHGVRHLHSQEADSAQGPATDLLRLCLD